jgi:hypothetical protein
MGRLGITVLIMGTVLSFHETLWPWTYLVMAVWAGIAVLEWRYNPDLWK